LTSSRGQKTLFNDGGKNESDNVGITELAQHTAITAESTATRRLLK